MKITTELSLESFEAWSGAISTKNTIIEAGKTEEFEALIEDCYPEGMTDTQLNDILWFEEDWLYECLGMNEEEEV